MFNTSTRKEDVSIKLKTQNLKNTRALTKKLEQESRHMEDRLQELKMAMTREREEREAKGGGFWQTGQEGKLGKYAQDVINKPAKKSASSNRERSSKSSKVKVLKDEPIVVPERKKGPGTMNNIAQQNPGSNKDKIKGPKCGQCEQKKAHVTCQECGEDYCAGCFAAFHLRGALKKHRSTPIGSNGMRPALSPRPNATPRSEAQMRMDSLRLEKEKNHLQIDYNDNRYQNDNYSGEVRSKPDYDQPSSGGGGALLTGEYDEGANEAEFQAALRAWREGRVESGANDAKENRIQTHRSTSQKITPRKTEAISTETEMGTIQQKPKPVEIKFTSKSSLTYAERLLLKRYRREELGTLRPGTDETSEKKSEEGEHVDFDEVVGLVTPRDGDASSLDPFLRSAHVTDKAMEYHVADEGLAEDMRSESRLSIIEMEDNMPARRLRHFDHTSDYQVMEGPDVPSKYPDAKTTYWSPMDRTPTPPKEGKHRYAFATPPSSGRPSPSGRPRSSTSRRSYVISPISSAMKQNKENVSVLDDPTNSRSIEGLKTAMSHSVLLNKGKSATDIGRESPQASARKIPPRPKSSARQRPSSRTKSRSGSRASSRPVSRAQSRISIYGEGILTKGPSESLKEVARLAAQMADPPEYSKAGLTEFFTVGVKPMEPKERTITPSGQRKIVEEEGGIPKWRVSNKLYSMSTKSWRPGSSLGDTVEDAQVTQHLDDRAIRQLEEKVSEAEKVALTPREELEIASIAPSTGTKDGSVVSWQYSDHKSGQRARVSSRESYDLQQLQERARERSEIMRERTTMKRAQAAEQDDDIFLDDSLPTSGRLQHRPGSGMRVGTPRTGGSRSNSRTKRPDSGRPGSRTPRPDSGRPGYLSRPLSQTGRMTPEGRATPTRPSSSSGRESRAILPDGDDMTKFDDVEIKDTMNADDEETIEQLEWELASQEGRLTAEGKVSRMSTIDPDLDEGELGILDDDGPGSGLSSPDPETDLLDRQLRESVLMEDFDEMEDKFLAEEVKALH